MTYESKVSDPQAVTAVAEELLRRRDLLLAEQRELIEERQRVLNRLRRIDRELADCRAVVRFFQLGIDIPTQDPDQLERERYERERAARHAAMRRAEEEELRKTMVMVPHHATALPYEPPRSAQATINTPLKSTEPPAPKAEPKTTPPLREIILDRLRSAGEAGLKAAAIREYYERTYGRVIHDKTVGMTLYRLQNDKLVRHEGHIWFLDQPKAETGNPGGGTPGPINPET